ncbi:MAG: GFA family protein [Pseudomonadota bacterium]
MSGGGDRSTAAAPSAQPSAITGRCACGAVRLRLRGPFRPVIGCHCETCRRQSGHAVAATAVALERLEIEGEDRLASWSAIPGHRRGFCATCGSLLLWEREGSGDISVMAGCLDAPTGLRLAAHIFAAEAGDYYTINDPVPVHEGDDRAVLEVPSERTGAG